MKTLLPEIDSADKRFHNGNPATGEQGTRVTDTWLNDVQDRVRDVQAEAHYVLQKAGFKPISNKATQLYDAIIKIISDNRNTASTTKSGEVQLTSAIDSNDEDKAATPKAVKTAFDRAVTAETNNVFQKIYIPTETLSLDLTNRQQIINLFGDKYRQDGYLTFANHNNAKSNITGLPLDMRSPIVMTFYMMNGYSIFYCHYVSLNRKFFSVANLNNATYKLNWVEDITNTGEQTINNQLILATSGWSKIKFPIDNGGEWRFEVNPNSETDPRFNVAYKMLNGAMRYCSFPVLEKNEVVAYRSWVDSQIANNFTRSKLTTQNLNDVKAYGVYAQEANREATTERNYPTNFAGTLIVYPSAYNVMQQYINFRTGETYQRNQNIDLRTWGEWKRVDGLGKVDESAISHAINGTNKAKVASEFALGELSNQFVGGIAFFARKTPPTGWLKANGAAVSRTTYAALFAAIGTTFGAGDGRTTFNLPDLRGEFIRGLDDGRNVDNGRVFGSAQGDAIRNIVGKLDGSKMGSGNQVLEGKMIATGAIGTEYQQRQWSGDQGGWGEQSVSFDFDASRVVPTANENRPRNIALLACIKY